MPARPRGRAPTSWSVSALGQSMEDEAERLEVLDGGFDRQAQSRRRSGVRRGRNGSSLLAAGPGVDPRALLAEAGDERGPGQLGDRPDPAQAEAG